MTRKPTSWTSSRGRSPLDPLAYQGIVGATFAKHDHRPLIVIGDRTWDRWQLGRLGCPHPVAALRVQRVIKTLQITTTKEFIGLAPAFAEYRDLGVASYWVVLGLLHDLGQDVEAAHGERASFLTLHRRALGTPVAKGRRKRRALKG